MSETSVTDTEMQPHMPKTGGNDPQRGPQGSEVHPEASTDGSKSASESDPTLTLATSTRPPREIHGIKWVFAVIVILSSVFLFALDQTIVADVQPSIKIDVDLAVLLCRRSR